MLSEKDHLYALQLSEDDSCIEQILNAITGLNGVSGALLYKVDTVTNSIVEITGRGETAGLPQKIDISQSLSLQTLFELKEPISPSALKKRRNVQISDPLSLQNVYIFPIQVLDAIRWVLLGIFEGKPPVPEDLLSTINFHILEFKVAVLEKFSKSTNLSIHKLSPALDDLTRSNTLQELFTKLTRLSKSLTNSDASCLLWLDQQRKGYRVVEQTGLNPTLLNLLIVSSNEVLNIYKTYGRETFFIENLDDSPFLFPEESIRKPLRSALGAFLVWGNSPKAILMAFSYLSGKTYSTPQRYFLKTIANIGAFLFEQQERLIKESAKSKLLKYVLETIEPLLQIDGFTSLIENVLPIVAENLLADRISLVNSQQHSLTVYSYSRRSKDFATEILPTKDLVLVLGVNPYKEEIPNEGLLSGDDYTNILMETKDSSWYLHIEGIKEPLELAERKELCELFSRYLGLGLINALQLEIEKRRKQEIQLVNDIALIGISSKGLKESILRILEKIKDFYDATHVSVSWFTKEADLIILSEVGSPSVRFTNAEGQQVIRKVIETSEPVVIEDFSKVNYLPLTGDGKSAVYVPLNSQAKTIGTLNIESNMQDAFNETFIPYLMLLGLYLGSFVELMRVFEEARSNLKILESIQAKLLESTRLSEIGNLAAGIAHEISNPLTIIQGYTEYYVNNEELPEKVREDLRRVLEAVLRASSIAKSLLEYARSTQEQTQEYLDINQQILKTVDIVHSSFSKENITFNLDLGRELPYFLGNKGAINQILMNLISNARDAMVESGKGHTISIKTEKKGKFILLTVQDDGPGIKGEDLPNIFKPFFTTKSPGKGTGLGLAIVEKLIHNMGGEIKVSSAPGKGTVFRIYLPVSVGVKMTEIESEEYHPEIAKIKGRKILVIDDEPDIVDLMIDILKILGQDPVGVSDPVKGMDIALNQRFDLIFLDIKMPTLSGLEIYNRLRLMNPDNAKVVVFITGDVGREEVRKFLEEEDVNYLVKPISLQDIANAIQKVIRIETRDRKS